MSNTTDMTTTCLPTEAYYHINRNTVAPKKPRFQEPQDPCVRALLGRLDTQVARSQEWESAFQLSFGEEAFDEDYPCIDWSAEPSEWERDAAEFAAAFIVADRFVASVMHRLFPFQYREMIPALTHALIAWSERRMSPLPKELNEEDALNLLAWSCYDYMAEWLRVQQ
jgi:hypothetical protein